jgi:organic radical activating enzyme
MNSLKISELFLSLQGEGARSGEASLFIRLQGCSVKHACSASGIVCDTEFESGVGISVEELYQRLNAKLARPTPIVWTGGEPTDQLTEEHVAFFKEKGFFQAIETSGVRPVPKGLDYVTVSPKVAEHILTKHFPDGVTELRYVRHVGQVIPSPGIKAQFYYLSPHSDGMQINAENLRHCVKLCLENPPWRLSVQMHKIWKLL